jgi:DNA-binding CsgD family transcriptional regulator
MKAYSAHDNPGLRFSYGADKGAASSGSEVFPMRTKSIIKKSTEAKSHKIVAPEGILLMNHSLKPIALDRGAASIFNIPRQERDQPDTCFHVPEEIAEVLAASKASDLPPVKTQFWRGEYGYVCRAYFIEPYDQASEEPMVVLHLQRGFSVGDAVYQLADRYHLTDREKEALMAISMGLASKEVAERMNISPNTVKAFLRLIMIKMGVSSRAGIMGKLLRCSDDTTAYNGNGNSNGTKKGALPA